MWHTIGNLVKFTATESVDSINEKYAFKFMLKSWFRGTRVYLIDNKKIFNTFVN